MKDDKKHWEYKGIDSQHIQAWSYAITRGDCMKACKNAGDKWAIFDPDTKECVYHPTTSYTRTKIYTRINKYRHLLCAY